MALSQGMIDTYWRRYNQRRALTGLPSSYQEQRGALDSIMEATANKDIREAEIRSQREIQNRQLSLQEEQAKNADRAATVSGVTGLASLGASSYLGYKYLNKPPSAMETAYTNYLKSQTPGMVAPAGAPLGASVPSVTAPAYSGAAVPGSVTAGASGVEYGSAAGAGSGGAGVLSGAGSGAATTTPVTASGGSTASGAVASEGVGLGSTFNTVVGPSALAGGVGGYAANKLGLFGADHPDTGAAYAAGGVGGAAAGALAGAAMTSWSGPGAIVGAVVGGIVGLVGETDSVVCTELVRQGRISERDRTKCVVFRFRNIPDDMFAAYLEWAKPHVEAMRRGGWRNMVHLPFAHAFVRYMIAIQDKRYPTFFERTVWNYAWGRCERIAHRHGAMIAQEVA